MGLVTNDKNTWSIQSLEDPLRQNRLFCLSWDTFFLTSGPARHRQTKPEENFSLHFRGYQNAKPYPHLIGFPGKKQQWWYQRLLKKLRDFKLQLHIIHPHKDQLNINWKKKKQYVRWCWCFWVKLLILQMSLSLFMSLNMQHKANLSL